MDWWNPKHSLLQMVPVKYNYFKDKIVNLKGLKILDVGCGGGLLSEEFARQGAMVTGIDISEPALIIARKHALLNNLNIEYKIGSAEEIPVSNDKFDIVICADCLEHVNNLEKVISEISRVLNAGGIFCYDTINKNFISRISVVWVMDKILRHQYKKLNVSEKDYSVHEWKKFIKPEYLFQVMEKYGLKNSELKGIQFGGINKHGIKTKIGNNTKIAYIGFAKKILNG